MDEGFLINIIKRAGAVRLSPAKKADIRHELERLISASPAPEPAPRARFVVPMWLRAHGLAFASALAGVAVIVSGTGVSLAAERSLPGDRLYPVKTSVNERVREALALSPEAKISWELERVSRRMAEADALSAQSRLSDDARAMIENEATEHASRAEELASDEEREYVDARLRETLASGSKVKASFEKRRVTISEYEEGEHDEKTELYDDNESDELERQEESRDGESEERGDEERETYWAPSVKQGEQEKEVSLTVRKSKERHADTETSQRSSSDSSSVMKEESSSKEDSGDTEEHQEESSESRNGSSEEQED